MPIVSQIAGDSSYTTQTNDTGVTSPYQQSVVPAPATDGFDIPDLNLDVARQHLSTGADMVKRPGVKAVLGVIFSKVCFYIGVVWELGLSGKVALILGALLVVSSIGYTLFH
jgi:hypothetical protein